MQFYPEERVGFEFTDENISIFLDRIEEEDTWRKVWEDKYGDFTCSKVYDEFCDEFVEFVYDALGTEPELRVYRWSKGGYIQGLQGFHYDKPYLAFDVSGEENIKDLENFFGLKMVEARYSEFC
jgi:hypothetical protein